MSNKQKIYIASDFHLGIHADKGRTIREDKILSWFDEIKHDAKTIILLGDSFDYWFEYKNAIPAGFDRFLSKLKEIIAMEIELIMFTGNHDVWLDAYIEEKIGAKVFRDPQFFNWNDKKIFMAHGDGLGPGDYMYKIIKHIFRNKQCQFLFRLLGPKIGLGIMKYCSKISRESQNVFPFNPASERLIVFAEEHAKSNEIDYYIFGHRHLPIRYRLSTSPAVYYNSGDWINHFSYLVFDDKELYLKFFDNPKGQIHGN